ncbi:GAF domain-containing protein [Paeniroseomonas aquatica]|uniref:GAF domain-containing protein n=1 Tax=Paeniroseomonas aquatica TaxID=373043 RepID=A0ABT8A139_9PROT|nr:PAS domain-containing sensor histidine kinase [Paeniroseomonas aquatica]MDN3563440.1 GAF domain-containing protein [Paeniroseomonas aquatica]
MNRGFTQAPFPAPGFGEADLSNCEREQIHLAASIQPHGALLLIREADGVVVQASANAGTLLGLPEGVLGLPLAALGGNLAERIAPHLAEPLQTLATAIRCRAGRPAASFDGTLHRPAGGGLIIELEPAGEAGDRTALVERMLQAVLGTYSPRVLCDEAARLFREVTGYDRVMIYRFDDEGHGEVVAEDRRPELEPYLGNRYPATDIPQIARRLYERNRVRVTADVGYAPVPLVPRLSPLTGEELDMSLCILRSISPMHVQYLKNMGVAATLVASLMVGGRLWGLVACHHDTPRLAPYGVRAAADLLAEAVGTRLAALECFVQAQAELSVRRLEQRMIEAISREGDWRSALFDNAHTLLQPVGATGAALLFEGETLTAGEVPATADLRELGRWLDGAPRSASHGPVVASTALGLEEPRFARLIPIASGVLATPVSTSPGEYLVWFRPEQVRTVTWGGDPNKPVVVGDDPAELSPRRSFAQWHQVVEATAEPWTPTDLATARLVGATVADVVLQFRSVRMLIAQDQLNQVRQQVGISDQPVVVADAAGRIQLSNAAFDRLLPRPRHSPGEAAAVHIEALLPHFEEAPEVLRRMRDVLENARNWRGEVRIRTPEGARPMLVRADPVYSAPERVLGFVFLFTDLTERKAADAARRRFQEGILAEQQPKPGRLDSAADLVFRNLLATVVENAQLAALEITDGVDVARIPAMLDSVRASAARTAVVLEHLIRHAVHATAPEPGADPAYDRGPG